MSSGDQYTIMYVAMCTQILALQQKIFDDVLETKNVKKVKMLLIYTCIPFLICATTGHW